MIDTAPMNETRYGIISERTEHLYMPMNEFYMREINRMLRKSRIEKESKLPDHLFEPIE